MYEQVTLWLHVSTENGHHQANKENFVKGTEIYYSMGSINYITILMLLCADGI